MQRICDRATVLAARQGYRRLRSAARKLPSPLAQHDGRLRRRRASAHPGSRQRWATVQLAVTRHLSVAPPATPFAAPLKGMCRSRSACRRSAGDCRRRRATGRASLFDALSGEYPAAQRLMAITHPPRSPSEHAGHHRPPPARCGLRAGRAPRPRGGVGPVAYRTMWCSRAASRTAEAFLGGGVLKASSGAGCGEEGGQTHLGSHGRAQERRGSRRPGRCPAATCRSSSSAGSSTASRRCWSSTSRPGASTRGRRAAFARRSSISPRAGSAVRRHQSGPGRDFRGRDRDRGDLAKGGFRPPYPGRPS